ncbi:hypothetical protein DB347_19165 [Opitutaceae bacterium EW11]|nr:hypothetical protein DB347_19165 [Opitutaceae bacterium EW11]
MATVLVVEDDRLSQRLLGKILSGAGHTVLFADTVQSAWDLLMRPTLADLVVLDNQLARGWGWELLERIRSDVVFQSLPVVVYTGHTERSSILKYVELGVQGMLVKPYRADIILAEVQRAVAADWMSRLIDSPDVACRRLGVNDVDYYSLVSAVASSLVKDIHELREAVKTRSGAHRTGGLLQRVFDQSASLGMPALKKTAEELGRAIDHRQSPDVQVRLNHLESIQRMLQHRANVYLGVQEIVAQTPVQKESPKPPTPAPVAPTGEPQTPFSLFVRRTAAAPMWLFGAYADRIGGGKLCDPEELKRQAVEGARPPLLEAVLHGAGYLRNVPQIALDMLTEDVAKLPDFQPLYLTIAKRVGTMEDEHQTIDMDHALNRLGVDRTGVFVTCARVARAVQTTSPLDLGPLLQHTLSVTLVSYEIAHTLRVSEEHLAAAAGLAHDVGKWILVLQEPALYGLTLAIALHRGSVPSAAEHDVFGVTHEQLGQAFLQGCEMPALLCEAAAFHSQPESASAGNLGILACVALANQLAWSATAETEEQVKMAQGEIIDPANPVWPALRSAGVELPMDVPELVDSLHRVASTALWISSLLAEWAKAKSGSGAPAPSAVKSA